MTIRGQFRDLFENMYTLEIVNSTVSGDTIVIGEHFNDAENDLMYFSDEPIEIDCDMEDLFAEIGMTSASINVVTREFMGDKLFANNARSATVRIWKENEIIYDGYVEAGTYDQPFTDPYDRFTINCIDKLSTLQYYKYKDITPNNIDTVKATLNTITFRDLITLCLGPVLADGIIYYDLSKGISSSRVANIFDDLKISEQVFVGDDYDSVWTYEDALREMLKYLNLHIRQVGKDFYIFDWDSIKNRRTDWINLSGNQPVQMSPSLIRLTASMNAGEDTTVSVDEVFNQVKVNCELNSEDIVIESPLDTNSLTSPYMNKQLFLKEYISWGDGEDACLALGKLVLNQEPDHSEYGVTDWYLQWLESKNWKFYTSDGELRTLYEQDANGTFIKQYKVSDRQQGTCQPALVGIGSVKKENENVFRQSEPTGYIKLSNYLIVSLNGNENDNEGQNYPSDNDIHNRQPIAEYLSTNSAAVFSPNDDETTNYLVFSGKLTFVPKQHQTGRFPTCVTAASYQDIPEAEKSEFAKNYHLSGTEGMMQLYQNTVPTGEDGKPMYYTRRWFHVEYPNDAVTQSTPYVEYGLMPPTDEMRKEWNYEYSEPWCAEDNIDNLDVFECELIIGNKRLIQFYGSEQGKATLEWVTIGQEPSMVYSEDGSYYTITTFQLGINPKTGDYILGNEFNIKSNVDYTMNIDTDGFAIPIKKSDNLSGQVIFRILGPVNTKWNQITRRHPSFWRSTRYYEDWHYILAHCENITIKEFKCELKSDNAGTNTDYINDDKELVYISTENNNYINIKDDVTFKFITQPTTQEALSKGIKTSTNYNAVLLTSSGGLLSNIWNDNTTEQYKAEEHYVSQYYLQYNTPKLLLDVDVWTDGNINYLNTYRYNALNRDFIVKSMKKTLHDNKTHLTLVEV